jgi:hypothetical protein
LVCHTCDNPSCVNPAHLWMGSAADNIADKVAKGRQATCERHGRSKLSAAAVHRIRTTGEGTRNLAREYGVARSTIQRIRNGRRWQAVA